MNCTSCNDTGRDRDGEYCECDEGDALERLDGTPDCFDFLTVDMGGDAPPFAHAQYECRQCGALVVSLAAGGECQRCTDRRSR